MRQRVFWPHLLLSVSVMLLLIGAWAPWANETQYMTDAPFKEPPYMSSVEGNMGWYVALTRVFGLSRFLINAIFAWDAVFLVGLALAFAFWFFLASLRRTQALLRALTIGWLALATITLAIGAYGIFGLHLTLACKGCMNGSIVLSSPAWGFWLAWIADLLTWAALILLLRQSGAAKATSAPADQATVVAPPSPLRWLAGASYTIGALLWGVALAMLPWVVSVGCPALNVALDYVNRNCIAADAFDVDYPYMNHIVDALALIHLSEALLLMGLIAVIVIWSRRRTFAVQALAMTWLILIALATWISIAGIQAMMTTTRQTFANQPADWKFGIGMYLALVGIALCACGVVLRVIPRRSARASATVGIAGA